MKRLISLIIMMMVLTGCSKKNEIYIISDLHYAGDVVYVGEGDFNKSIRDGRLQTKDDVLLDTIIDLVNANKPKALVITGDVTFNGQKEAAVKLSEKLATVNKNTKVLVIPGNHDLYIQDCYIYSDTVAFKAERLENESFKEVFKDQGYKDALSIDTVSNSYVLALNDHLWLLMLDTTASRYNDEYKQNISNGYIEDETFTWIEDILKQAKEKNIEVISFSHQNVLSHSEAFKTGYVIEQADRLKKLYKEYGVKLNFSGHLHIQSIKQDENISDIATSSILVYGNRYGVLEIDEEEYRYNSYKLNVKGENIQDESLNRFIEANKRFGSEALALLRAYYFDGDYKSLNKLLEEYPELKENLTDELLNLGDDNQRQLVIKK